MARFLILAILLSSGTVHAAKKKTAKPPVTILDMSTPEGPTSDFPDIVRKGKI